MGKDKLIVGIGNILLRDEGLGVRVVEAMQGLELPQDVEAIDGGTSGADLIEEIADRAKLIVVDCLDAKAKPGSVFQLSLEDLLSQDEVQVSVHEFGIIQTIRMAQNLGVCPPEIVIFGVQPLDMSPGLEMTPEIVRMVPSIIDLLLQEAARPLRVQS